MNQLQEVASAELALLVRKQLNTSICTMQAVLQDPKATDALVSAAECTAGAMKSGRKLLVAGNGGSAAGAQHLAAEFVSRLTFDRRALPAIALTVDTSILTAIGNDYDYQNVFERQIEAWGQSGDVFLALSTSGNSKNILKGLVRARAMEIQTIGFSGNNGGSMDELCDYSIVVPSTVTMNIQECHLALEHTFCGLVEKLLLGMEFGAQ